MLTNGCKSCNFRKLMAKDRNAKSRKAMAVQGVRMWCWLDPRPENRTLSCTRCFCWRSRLPAHFLEVLHFTSSMYRMLVALYCGWPLLNSFVSHRQGGRFTRPRRLRRFVTRHVGVVTPAGVHFRLKIGILEILKTAHDGLIDRKTFYIYLNSLTPPRELN